MVNFMALKREEGKSTYLTHGSQMQGGLSHGKIWVQEPMVTYA